MAARNQSFIGGGQYMPQSVMVDYHRTDEDEVEGPLSTQPANVLLRSARTQPSKKLQYKL